MNAILSAGVGRTGTYIAIDSLLEMIKSNLEINVFKFINGLREQRVLMVQQAVRIAKRLIKKYKNKNKIFI